MRKKPEMTMLGNQFDKPDLERLGLFIEMPYMNGKGYVFPKPKRDKGLSMLSGGPKVKAGTQDGYFDKSFARIFSKEALIGRGRKKLPSKFKNVSERPFMPPSHHKHHACPGDFFGTFGGRIEALSNKKKPKPPYKKESPNFLTNFGKKGGPGYANICLSPYPEYIRTSRYGLKAKYKEYGKVLDGPMRTMHWPEFCFDPNPFKEPENFKPGPTYVRPKDKKFNVIPPGKIIPTGPAKWQGGCHAGCFDKFPEHKPEKYVPAKAKVVGKNVSDQIYGPPSRAMKSLFTISVLNHNVDFRVNQTNYGKVEPTYIKHLVN